MGQTIRNLSKRKLSGKQVFPHRFVIEVCEEMHVHYKNLRLMLKVEDWVELARGFKKALDRWKKRGSPIPAKGSHIELCRKKISHQEESDEILVNLNKNLYRVNNNTIFSEGSDFDEPTYIHLKVRDCRLEISIEDFKVLAYAINEAKESLDSSSNASDI